MRPRAGLTAEQFLNVGTFEVTKQRAATTEFEVKELSDGEVGITPLFQQAMAWSSKSSSFGSLLYISPAISSLSSYAPMVVSIMKATMPITKPFYATTSKPIFA
ncbi:MAG: hypothetical protein R2822_00195 [Spirosomataceae bacterium]